MKRIEAVLTGKIKSEFINNKLERIKKAIELARLNAEDDLIKNKMKIDDLLNKFSTDTDVNSFITELSTLLAVKDSINDVNNRINDIERLLFEDIKIEE